MSTNLDTAAVPSLRVRIFLGTSVALAVVVLVGALAVWLAARAVLGRGLDDALRERAHALSARVGPRGPPRSGWNGRPGPPERRDERPPSERRGDERSLPPGALGVPPDVRFGEGNFLMQVIAEDGHELGRSPSLPEGDSLAALVPADLAGDRIAVVYLHDGRPFHVIAERLPAGPTPQQLPPWLTPTPGTAPMRGNLTFLIAIDATPMTGDLERLAVVLAALWLVTTALGVVTALWLQRTVLRPVAQISHAIAGLGPDDLHARLSAAQVPREMQIIPQRLNDLLGRLEAAFLREKATIANIAHELRTPVAGLRMTLELALAAKPNVTEQKTLSTCLRITESMQAMIANLLTLARLEAGQLPPVSGESDGEEIARTCWQTLEPHATERGVQVRWQISAELPLIRAAPEQLQMVIGNLLDNAVSYTPHAGEILISITHHAPQISVVVSNPTDGTLHDCSVIFVPFWRGDHARSGELHCGLGLSLVQRLVTAMGGTVTARLTEPRLFQVEVRLPAVADELPITQAHEKIPDRPGS